jgi:hypothetical protein
MKQAKIFSAAAGCESIAGPISNGRRAPTSTMGACQARAGPQEAGCHAPEPAGARVSARAWTGRRGPARSLQAPLAAPRPTPAGGTLATRNHEAVLYNSRPPQGQTAPNGHAHHQYRGQRRRRPRRGTLASESREAAPHRTPRCGVVSTRPVAAQLGSEIPIPRLRAVLFHLAAELRVRRPWNQGCFAGAGATGIRLNWHERDGRSEDTWPDGRHGRKPCRSPGTGFARRRP